MKRLLLNGFIGFQPANDAPESVDTITLSDVGSPSQSDVVAKALSQGLVKTDFTQIKFEDEGYAEAMAAYQSAATENPYLIAKNEAAQARIAAEDEALLSDLMADAEPGFVNLHTNDNENGKGDGKWYALDSDKTQHDGEPEMTRGEAIKAGIDIG